MLALKIISLVLGGAFSLFGYFIFFRKKYFLINRFDEDYKSGRRTEEYAKRVGLVELIAGILLLITSALLFIFV